MGGLECVFAGPDLLYFIAFVISLPCPPHPPIPGEILLLQATWGEGSAGNRTPARHQWTSPWPKDSQTSKTTKQSATSEVNRTYLMRSKKKKRVQLTASGHGCVEQAEERSFHAIRRKSPCQGKRTVCQLLWLGILRVSAAWHERGKCECTIEMSRKLQEPKKSTVRIHFRL